MESTSSTIITGRGREITHTMNFGSLIKTTPFQSYSTVRHISLTHCDASISPVGHNSDPESPVSPGLGSSSSDSSSVSGCFASVSNDFHKGILKKGRMSRFQFNSEQALPSPSKRSHSKLNVTIQLPKDSKNSTPVSKKGFKPGKTTFFGDF